jgi:hypothetical protein
VKAGAIGLVVINTKDEPLMNMINPASQTQNTNNDSNKEIPAVSMRLEEGAQLKVELADEHSTTDVSLIFASTWRVALQEITLREALHTEPQNLIVRQQLANTLVNLRQHTEAMQIYHDAYTELDLQDAHHASFRQAIMVRSTYTSDETSATIATLDKMQRHQKSARGYNTCYMLAQLILKNGLVMCKPNDPTLRRVLEFCLLDIGGPFLLLDPDVISLCARKKVLNELKHATSVLTTLVNTSQCTSPSFEKEVTSAMGSLQGRLLWHIAEPKERIVAITVERCLTAMRRVLLLTDSMVWNDLTLEFVSGLAILCHSNDFLMRFETLFCHFLALNKNAFRVSVGNFAFISAYLLDFLVNQGQKQRQSLVY